MLTQLALLPNKGRLSRHVERQISWQAWEQLNHRSHTKVSLVVRGISEVQARLICWPIVAQLATEE